MKLLSTKLANVLAGPIAEWPMRLMSVPDRQSAEQELTALVQRAALLSAYLSHRYTTGCGEQPHESSARHANRVLVRIRRALGYSYPSNTGIRIA